MTHKRFSVWLAQAKYDLEAAKDSAQNSNHEWACYQSTQAVEKAIKSVIAHAGWNPPKVHKLGVLMGMANKANNLFFDIKFEYRKVEAFTYISRYPFLIPEQNKPPHEFITHDDSTACITIAEEILQKIDGFIQQGKVEHKGKEESIKEVESYYYSQEEIDERIAQVIEQIKQCEKLEVSKIILYGSYAREKTRPRTSTMDILIVAETDLPFIERIQYVREITRGGEPIVEALIYTPSEFQFMLEEEGAGYLESAIEEGKVLWEK